MPVDEISRSPSRSRSQSPSEEEVGGAGRDEKPKQQQQQLVFLFFNFLSGPIASALYAVEAPPPCSELESSPCCDEVSKPDPPVIYPILEFPSGEYPDDMCCVELDSKLYFLGGEVRLGEGDSHAEDSFDPAPRDVYVLDATGTGTAAATINRPLSKLLKKGTPMNSGKPQPYVFVADGRIYVIVSGLGPLIYGQEFLSRFEFFDPDTNQWSTMPDPPVSGRLIGHAVVDRRVFLVESDSNIVYFHLDKREWVDFKISCRGVPAAFYSQAVFIEDNLYACSRGTLAAFGPISAEAKELFRPKAWLTHEVVNLMLDRFPTPNPIPYLFPLGNRTTFGFVLAGALPDPNTSDGFFYEDPERFQISLNIWEALKDTYTKLIYNVETAYFRGRLLRSADFVATSRYGARADFAELQCCFSIPLL